MKILQINKFYFLKGGAERYLFGVSEVLQRHGHTVIPFAMEYPENFPTPYSKYFVSEMSFRKNQSFGQKIKIAANIIWSREAVAKLEALIKETKPDIAHLHNIAHQLSPSIIHVLRRHQIPIVQTLHDYKLISPNYNLFRNDGTVCNKCATPPYRFWKPFTHRCLPSLGEQWLLGFEMMIHRMIGSYRLVDRFIAPSKFMKDLCVRFGIPEKKVIVLPYLLDVAEYKPFDGEPVEPYLLYFGRLSKEKGIDVLLEAMKQMPDMKLTIVGTGPEEHNCKLKIKNWKLQNVEMLGYKTGEELKRIIAEASAVVVPSLWYENSPLVMYEAYASGVPVVASRIGGIPGLVPHLESTASLTSGKNSKYFPSEGLVQDRVNGVLFTPGDANDLAQKVGWFIRQSNEQKAEMRKAARAFAEAHFDPEKHYGKLMEIYEHTRK